MPPAHQSRGPAWQALRVLWGCLCPPAWAAVQLLELQLLLLLLHCQLLLHHLLIRACPLLNFVPPACPQSCTEPQHSRSFILHSCNSVCTLTRRVSGKRVVAASAGVASSREPLANGCHTRCNSCISPYIQCVLLIHCDQYGCWHPCSWQSCCFCVGSCSAVAGVAARRCRQLQSSAAVLGLTQAVPAAYLWRLGFGASASPSAGRSGALDTVSCRKSISSSDDTYAFLQHKTRGVTQLYTMICYLLMCGRKG